MDQDPKQNHHTQEQQGNWELDKSRSIIATLALNSALLLNGALPHGELLDYHKTRTEHTQEVVVDKVSGEVTTTQDVAMPFQSAEKVDEQWARRFADDPQAGELVKESETTRVAAGIKELLDANDDCRIDTIELTGQASDDDDNTNERGVRTAGLGELDTDGENVELAEKRSNVFEEKLRAELSAQGVDVGQLPIVQLPSVEDLMTETEIEQVDAFVEQFGYSSRAQLIEQYNRNPDSMPPATVVFFDQALKAERTVTVAIKGNCLNKVQTTTEVTEYVERVERNEVQKEIEISIPWFMIIPVPIPRRNKDRVPDPIKPASTPPPVAPPRPEPRPILARDHAFRRRDDRKYTGPDRGPKRYVGPNVHGGYWHV